MVTQRLHTTLMLSSLLLLSAVLRSQAQLSPDFYEHACPLALPTIRAVVRHAIIREPRMGASLLRLHFHDCFVNGCDGSVLLDDTDSFIGEKTAPPNNNSLRGFEVVDMIKSAVNLVCHRNVVSCADIIAVAARDSINMLGGPYYEVQLGRRDAQTTSREATSSIPSPALDLTSLILSFRAQGLSLRDLVVLSGAHTLGFARCTTFKNRIYDTTSTTNIHPFLASQLQWICPPSGGDDNLAPLDLSPMNFDSAYFLSLVERMGLLNSDQQLFKGDRSASDRLVKYYTWNHKAFRADFAVAMVKMGNIRPLSKGYGEIRMNCRRVN